MFQFSKNEFKVILKFVFVVDTDNKTELRDLNRRIHDMIDTELISISMSTFSVSKLENNI